MGILEDLVKTKCNGVGQGSGHWILGSSLSGDTEKEKAMSPECGFLPSQQHPAKKTLIIFLSTGLPVAIFSILLFYNA